MGTKGDSVDTLKRFVVGLVVVLVAFAATGCATGGYLGPKPYGGPLGEVVAGNLALTCPGDYFVGPPVNGCLRHLTNIGPRFAGYPMYVGSRSGRQLSRTEKIAIVGGIGAVVGAAISGDWRGAVIGGAAGAIATAAVTRGDRNVRIADDGTPIAVGRPVVQPQSQSGLWGTSGGPNCLQQGLVTLHNLTGEILGVFEEGANVEYEDPLAVLQPREARCGDPDLRYEAWVKQTAVSADRWVGGTQRIPRRPEARPGLVLVWR